MKKSFYNRIFTVEFLQGSVFKGFANLSDGIERAYNPLKLYLTICLVIFGGILSYYAYFFWKEVKILEQQKNAYIVQYQYWSQVVSEHPNFPDAHYNLAVYALRLKLNEKASFFANKALLLDPTFEKAESLKQEISKQMNAN